MAICSEILRDYEMRALTRELYEEGKNDIVTDFIRVFDRAKLRVRLKMEIYYSNVMDYVVTITREGTKERPGNEVIFEMQHCNPDYIFAKAKVSLMDWLEVHDGGC